MGRPFLSNFGMGAKNMKLTFLAGSVAVAEAWEWSLVEEVTCSENSSYNECGSDREICGGWSNMEHDSMTSDCYQGCFCDDGFIQTRAGVCIPEAECAPAGEITCLVAQFESYLTFFGFDPSLISGFDWSWSGIGHNCGTSSPPSPKTPKTKTPKTKTPKTKSPKTKTPKSGKGKKSGRRRRELDSPAPKDKKHTGKYGKSGKGKSGKGKSGKGKSGKGKS